MIPDRIKPYFHELFRSENNDCATTEGTIECCNSRSFIIKTNGAIHKGFGGRLKLFPRHEGLAVNVICAVCGKSIPLFDSTLDGYDNANKSERQTIEATTPLECKCTCREFSVKIKYEYPSTKELLDLCINSIDNAFSWIWISLTCNKCGQQHTNFVDYETA